MVTIYEWRDEVVIVNTWTLAANFELQQSGVHRAACLVVKSAAFKKSSSISPCAIKTPDPSITAAKA
jgi:hypothetical protein